MTTTYRSVSSISSGSSYVITVYSSGKYYALTHTGGALGVTAVTVSNGQIVSDVTDDMLWTYSGGKLGFTSGGANYYLGRYGYSSLSISTSGLQSELQLQPSLARRLLSALFQRVLLPEPAQRIHLLHV